MSDLGQTRRFTSCPLCPICPQYPTCPDPVATSQLGQNRTFRVQSIGIISERRNCPSPWERWPLPCKSSTR
jgi:hypothetical protein